MASLSRSLKLSNSPGRSRKDLSVDGRVDDVRIKFWRKKIKFSCNGKGAEKTTNFAISNCQVKTASQGLINQC